jgi:hypothetical protein
MQRKKKKKKKANNCRILSGRSARLQLSYKGSRLAQLHSAIAPDGRAGASDLDGFIDAPEIMER